MNKLSKKNKCAKFIKILSSMLRNPQSFLEWSADQTYFTISDILSFIQNSLPTYFKHSNLSSFIRQLNLYGFKKLQITQTTPENSYCHEYFKKTEPNLSAKIQRRFIKKGKKYSKGSVKSQQINSSSQSGQSDKIVYESKLELCQSQLRRIRQQNYKLAEENGGLKYIIRQAQNQMFNKNSFRFTQFAHDGTANFQNRTNSAFNNYRQDHIGMPFSNQSIILQQLGSMNPSLSVSSYGASKSSSSDNKQ